MVWSLVYGLGKDGVWRSEETLSCLYTKMSEDSINLWVCVRRLGYFDTPPKLAIGDWISVSALPLSLLSVKISGLDRFR